MAEIEIVRGNEVQVEIKYDLIPEISSLSNVEFIRSTEKATRDQQVISEGVQIINADLAHQNGLTGDGVKVAVFDFGFDVNSPEISKQITNTKSFRDAFGTGKLPLSGVGDDWIHGTAVAEIVSDIAPDAQLFLISMKNGFQFKEAVDWALSKNVDIIVMSVSWTNYHTDGQSSITKKVEEAIRNGIVFVTSAGNYADSHWEGNFKDGNSNGWHDFAFQDDGLSIEVNQRRGLDTPIVAHLIWNNQNSPDVYDFDLSLVDPAGKEVASSANWQHKKDNRAVESLEWEPDVYGTYVLGVYYNGIGQPDVELEIFSPEYPVDNFIESSSVVVPADAEGIISVGAINHKNLKIEDFSSQGKTNKGDPAPTVVAPDGVSTSSYGNQPFWGTSASAPYVGGLAALIIQQEPGISPKDLSALITDNTNKKSIDLQQTRNNLYGYGLVDSTFLSKNEQKQNEEEYQIILNELKTFSKTNEGSLQIDNGEITISDKEKNHSS